MQRIIIDQLVNWKNSPNRRPLIFTGARQVGKTYSLKFFGDKYFSKHHYINFEEQPSVKLSFSGDLDPQTILNSLYITNNIKVDPTTDLLIFDEIQLCPEALTALKYFSEKLPTLAVIGAGSLLGVTLANSPFPVGKVDHLNMYPMTFLEFVTALGEEGAKDFLVNLDLTSKYPEAIHQKLWNLFKIYLAVGGLPRIVSNFSKGYPNLHSVLDNTHDDQGELLKNYLADFSKYSGQANALHLERIFSTVPVQLACSQDESVSRFKFKGVVPKISQYDRLATAIDWLKASGLILKVPVLERADLPPVAAIKESRFKLYLLDVGLLRRLADIPFKDVLTFDFGTYKGYFAENFVAQQLTAQLSTQLYSWQSNSSEIEFLVSTFDGLIPIEVKSGRFRRARSLSSYVHKYNPPKQIIFSGDLPVINREKGIFRLPLYLAGLINIAKL